MSAISGAVPTAPAIQATGVRKAYAGTTVLDGVDVRLGAGETLALLGPNGAGKTTTVEILAGFLPRDGGEVSVLGQDPAREAGAQWRARIGMAIQVGRDHPKWRVREFLAWVQAHYPADSHPRDVDDLLATFGLSGHAQRSVLTLSGGLRRRLDLAAAVVGRPDLLILDEPTTGLDPSARRAVHDLVADQVESGSSLLLTTHDLAEAERLADRILVLDRGRVVAQGSPDELRRSVEGQAEITWTSGGTRHLHVSAAPEDFLRELLTDGGVSGLEVHRPTLEDAYLRLVTPDADGARARPDTLHPVTTDEETAR